MEYTQKLKLSTLTSQVKAISTMQSNSFSQMTFINDLGDILESSYNSDTGKYSQEGIDKLINTIVCQVDGYYKSSLNVLDDNYHLNNIVEGLTDQIQEGL